MNYYVGILWAMEKEFTTASAILFEQQLHVSIQQISYLKNMAIERLCFTVWQC